MMQSHALTAQDVGKHYDDLNLFYRNVWGDHVHHGLFEGPDTTKEEAVLALLNKVAILAEVKAGQKVCDIGCGYGATGRYLAENFKAKVSGVTVSQQQLKIGQTLQGDSAGSEMKYCDWLENDFKDESFDVALSIESAEHMLDRPKFFQEAFRVLKPGGRFVICAWLANEAATTWDVKHLLEPICHEGRLPSLETETDYRNYYRTSGFQLVEALDCSNRVKRTWTLCISGIAKYVLKNPSALAFLLNKKQLNRVFLKTLFRMRLAYETGAMRYVIFSGVKPERRVY